MKYSIIWRPHKINCTKVLIRFIWAWRFSNSHDQRQEPDWPWAWIMIKPDSMGSCLETKNKLHTVSFFLSFLKSSLILYSPVSGCSCVVAWSMEFSCCECESVTVSLDHIQITSDTVITIKIFWGKHNNHSYHTNHTLFSFIWSMNW